MFDKDVFADTGSNDIALQEDGTAEGRPSFTFYKSFFDAMVCLEPMDQNALFMAVCRYALYEITPNLSGVPAAMFMLIKPNLDVGMKRSNSGSVGGKAKSTGQPSNAEASGKQTPSKPRANTKQMVSDIELGIRNKELGSRSEEDESKKPRTPKSEPKVQLADHVTMTNAEHQKLLDTYGPADTVRLIEILDNYKGSSGKTYKDDYRAILSWCVDRLREETAKGPRGAVDGQKRKEASQKQLADEIDWMERFLKQQEGGQHED